MEEDAGPVILINKFSVDPKEFDQLLKGYSTDNEKLSSNQDLSRHSYTGVLAGAAPIVLSTIYTTL